MEKLYQRNISHLSRETLLNLVNDNLTKEEEKFTLNHLEICSKCKNEMLKVIKKMENDSSPSLLKNYELESELEDYFSEKESSIETVNDFFEKLNAIDHSLQSYITINLYKVFRKSIGLKKGLEESQKNPEKVDKEINPNDKFGLIIDSDREGYMILLLEADGNTYLLCPSFFIPEDKICKGENRYPKDNNKYHLEFESSENPEHKIIAYITSEKLNLDFIKNVDISQGYYILSDKDIRNLSDEVCKIQSSNKYIDIFEKVYSVSDE